MKNLLGTLTLAIALMIAGHQTTHAQNLTIKVQPPARKVVVVKPIRPSVRHVWVDGHWKWNARAGRYVWAKGYWVKPNRGRVYVNAHYVKVRGGYKYVPGRWTRV